MATRLTVGLSAALLGLAGLIGAGQPAHAASSVQAKGKLLYTANFRTTLKASKWKAATGFKVSRGMLTYNGANDAGAFAPFTTKRVKNFAVEAVIKTGTPTKPDTASYDIFARRNYNDDHSGIFAGYDAVGGDSAAVNVADLFWHGSEDNYVPGGSLPLDTSSFHTDRLEVRGKLYRFLVDGQQLIPWTTIADSAKYNQVGLTFTYVPAQVKSFKVYRLAKASAKSDLNTTLLISHSIGSTDANVPPVGGIFRNNDLFAKDNGETVADVASTGRITGYLEKFANQSTFVSEALDLHSSATGARTAFTQDQQLVQANKSKFDGYVENTVAQGLGDAAFSYSYHYVYDNGQTSYVTIVIFSRGSYYVTVVVDSFNQADTANAMTYAQKADQLLQH